MPDALRLCVGVESKACTYVNSNSRQEGGKQKTRGLGDCLHSSRVLVLASSPRRNSSRSAALSAFDFNTAEAACTVRSLRSASSKRARAKARSYDSFSPALRLSGTSFGAELVDCSRSRPSSHNEVPGRSAALACEERRRNNHSQAQVIHPST